MFISYSNVFNHQSSMTNIKRNQSIAEEHIYIIQVLEKHFLRFYLQFSHWRETIFCFIYIMWTFSEIKQPFYCGQASILITLTCSPAHLLDPTSHSVIVMATLPTPELTHRGAESLGHPDAVWHSHFPADFRIEKQELLYIYLCNHTHTIIKWLNDNSVVLSQGGFFFGTFGHHYSLQTNILVQLWPTTLITFCG